MPTPETGRRRRKEARPAEIVAAAMAVFADHGFAAAKLKDVARRAGIVKGSIYLYFPSKEELFRAVVREAIVPSLEAVRRSAEAIGGSLSDVAPRLLAGAAGVLGRPSVFRIVRMVIGEARNFPDLARIWHDEVVAPMLAMIANVIAGGQARGEIRAGDPRLYAFSLISPMFMSALFRDLFGDVSQDPPDLARLADQHAALFLRGLMTPQSS